MKNDFFKYNLENNELFYYPFLRLNDTFSIFFRLIFVLYFPKKFFRQNRFYFILNYSVSFRFGQFRFDLFRFVSVNFVSFRWISFRFDFISHFTDTLLYILKR